jgi:hypothetical protein
MTAITITYKDNSRLKEKVELGLKQRGSVLSKEWITL